MGLQRHFGRATGILLTGALSISLLTGSHPGARADGDTAPGQKTGSPRASVVDVDIANVRLQDALRMIESKTGINYVLVNPQLQYNSITLTLSAKPIDVVLRQMALAAGADLWVDGGIYYIGPKGSAPKAPEPIADPLPPAPAPRPKLIQKLQLMYSEPNSVLAHLFNIHRGSALEDYLDIFRNNVIHMLMKQSLPGENAAAQNITAPFTIVPGQPSGPSVAPYVPTNNTRGENILNNINGSLPRSGGALSLPQNIGDQISHRDGDAPGEFAGRGGQFPGGLQGGGGFGGGGLQGGGGFGGGGLQPGGGFGGGGLQPGGPGGGGQAGGANLLAEFGITGQVLANPDDNSIILITDDPADFDKLKQLIRTIDVKPRQVMIRAEFVTVTSNGTNGFGINWTFQKVNLIGGSNTGFSTTNTAFLQYATGNLQTELSFILTSGQGRLVAAPLATTLNNVPVTFTQTNEQPVFVSQPVVTPGGTTVIAQTIIPIPVTQGLIVLPRINGDDSLTLFGTAISTSLGAPITGPNGESFPNITVQTAPIQRIIRNGDTMVISGLTSKNDVLTENKVPLLGDLPLIGNLFRSRNTTTSDAELLVFITPTIIQERPSQAAIGGGVGGTLTAPGAGPGGGAGGGVIPGGGQ